jgi:hypothetical protein
MKRRWIIAMMLVTGALVAAVGCSRDLKRVFQTNPQMRERVIEVVSTDSTLAAPVLDHMMQADSTQSFLLRRVLSNPRTVQALMMHMASDRTMVDGILNVAVQDSGMRDHVVTLIDGMRMLRKVP